MDVLPLNRHVSISPGQVHIPEYGTDMEYLAYTRIWCSCLVVLFDSPMCQKCYIEDATATE